jgi:hypothetical protein
MSSDDLTSYVEENFAPNPGKKLREAVSDAVTFIHSMEINQAIATVTLEQLMGDQIKRNGESARSNAAQYDPYTYSPNKKEGASKEEEARANFLGGTDLNRPTKLDRVLAVANTIVGVIDEIKKLSPTEVSGAMAYSDVADVGSPEDEIDELA